MRRMAGGFTLIELMIAVVIVGVLAAIALPAYGNYVLRSNRTVGKSMLTEILGRQESYFVDRKQYAATLTALGYPANTIFLTRDGKPNGASTSSAVYSITVATYAAANLDACGFSGTPAAPVMQFAIVATPINAQVKDDKCQKLCVSSLGEKDAQGPDASCWRS